MHSNTVGLGTSGLYHGTQQINQGQWIDGTCHYFKLLKSEKEMEIILGKNKILIIQKVKKK